MKKLALCLILACGLGCVAELKPADQSEKSEVPNKTVPCFQCDHKECQMYKLSGNLSWYKCSKCGAEMVYHIDNNKWVLFSYERGDKLEK